MVFAVTSMLSVGFGHTVREIIGPLRHARGVMRALVANFVLVPLLAFGVARLLSLNRPLEIGLMLIAMAAGAPFLIKLTEHADHDIGLSATLLVLLLPATVLYMPLVVPLVVPNATVDAWSIAMPLLLTMLLPLGIGLLVRERSPAWAEVLQPFMGRTSSIALLVLMATTCVANLRGILNILGTGAIIGAFLIGYALGGHDRETRGVLGLATGQRNIAAATVVANQGFGDPGILVMVVTSSLVGLALLFPTARILRQRLARRAAIGTGGRRRKQNLSRR
ncbi:MAG TPA: bile acid:sodium symporter [Clostridia bacterium]|nr:bile acid:sodium symporter [Clostridia bacterium]